MQNLLVMRFANSIFEPLWNQKYIDHVQITVAEEEGARRRPGRCHARRLLRGGRRAARHGAEPHPAAPVRDGDGAAVVARPPTWSATTRSGCSTACVRSPARTSSASWCAPSTSGLRRAGVPAIARTCPATGDEQKLSPAGNSTTETYVAIKLFVDNWRWAGVPFYLRTGKRLPKRVERDRDPVQGSAADPVQRASRTSPLEPNVLVAARSSRTRACRCASPRSSRARRSGSTP